MPSVIGQAARESGPGIFHSFVDHDGHALFAHGLTGTLPLRSSGGR